MAEPKNKKRIQWQEESSARYPNLTPCWNCVSHAPNRDGYRVVGVGKKREYVHRFIYEECFGLLAPELMVRHKCDNPSCINPEHLTPGTHLDNSRDMLERKRSGTGITPERCEEIRGLVRSGLSMQRVGENFGLCKAMVWRIWHRKIKAFN